MNHETRPPRDLEELLHRARRLAGHRVAPPLLEDGEAGSLLHQKGKLGQLLERVLGATAGSAQRPDFPDLGVELKTIPVDASGKPRESTFVSSLSLVDADQAEWEVSAVRRKLQKVLWIPLVTQGDARVLGAPLLWQPTCEQEQVLRADFDDIMGMIAIGNVEGLTARVGRWLQARPKAAHGGVRTRAYGAREEPLSVLPRGFYLRASFTGALLEDPGTLAGA
jgi:DNA mismatch repair protein MutH